MLLLSSTGTFLYFKLNGNITSIPEDPNDHHSKSAGGSNQPMNVLLMGSDTRSGKNGKVVGGKVEGFGSADTAMVLHVAADHQHATVMSLPRDLVIQLPQCRNQSGRTVGGTTGQINWAYANGGPLCSRKTVEQLTGIHIDHFIVLDFSGFVKMINSIGGVSVCVPQTVNDTHGNIHLKAGTYTVKGSAALDYVRERQGLGDGGDRSRITRQHAFISSMINKMQSNGVLLNPTSLYGLINNATQAITVDQGLGSVTKLLSFAESIKGIKPANIKFFTVKTQNYPPTMPNYNTWKQQLALAPGATQEFAALAKDTAVGAAATKPVTGATTAAVSGAGVKVAVFNGTTRPKLAAKVADSLRGSGFTIVGTPASAKTLDHTTTLIQYGIGQRSMAQTLAKLFPGAKLKPTHETLIKLTVGADYTAPAGKPAKAPATITNARSASSNICSGLEKGD
ncbi:MAG: transcriptional regulator [Actinomycetia bacterium]|nr:transcriptional regulator [Actinomycetes bacterium]